MTLTAIIEKAQNGGISIRAEEPNGLFAYGLTLEEAKQEFIEVLEEQAEYYEEIHGCAPDWKDAQIDYVYDISGFFEAFPFINISAFATAVGLNPSLMRKYKGGIVVAGEKQRRIIQDGYNRILSNMREVKF